MIAISQSFLFAETTIATDEEQATGLEKKELTALVAGVEVRQLLSGSNHPPC